MLAFQEQANGSTCSHVTGTIVLSISSYSRSAAFQSLVLSHITMTWARQENHLYCMYTKLRLVLCASVFGELNATKAVFRDEILLIIHRPLICTNVLNRHANALVKCLTRISSLCLVLPRLAAKEIAHRNCNTLASR